MSNLCTLLDNLYSNTELTLNSKYLCSTKNIYKECLIKTSSRYKINGVNYSPYKITKQFYDKLFSNVILMPNLFNEDIIDPLVSYNDSHIIVKICNNLTNLMYNGDITTNGLLALRYKRCFGNYEFRDKINSDLSKFMIHYEYKLSRYFIDHDVYKLIFKYDNPELTEKLVSKYGFKWRD